MKTSNYSVLGFFVRIKPCYHDNLAKQGRDAIVLIQRNLLSNLLINPFWLKDGLIPIVNMTSNRQTHQPVQDAKRRVTPNVRVQQLNLIRQYNSGMGGVEPPRPIINGKKCTGIR